MKKAKLPEAGYRLCRECGQPMKPKGVKKKPDEYDHAQGCRYSRAVQR